MLNKLEKIRIIAEVTLAGYYNYSKEALRYALEEILKEIEKESEENK